MTKIGFDNETYLQLQSKKILERVDRFGGKLYLEFGGPGGCSGGAANLSLWENAAKGGKRGSERSNFAAAS